MGKPNSQITPKIVSIQNSAGIRYYWAIQPNTYYLRLPVVSPILFKTKEECHKDFVLTLRKLLESVKKMEI